MTNLEIRNKARELLMPACRVCPECNGVACRGEVPGMGGKGTGASFINNYNAVNAISINMRVVHDVKEADTSCELFGQKMALPVFGAPMTGTVNSMGGKLTDLEFFKVFATGCQQAGILASLGDAKSEEIMLNGLNYLEESGTKALVFIKPWLNQELLKRVTKINPVNSPVIGSDLDGCGLIMMNEPGMGVFPKSKGELKELMDQIDLPFIIKGVLTVEDAVACYEAGAKGIVVSNHGGRVLDYARATAEALPPIVAALKGKLTILVDGGIRNGVDVFKMLALGADGVMIGRPFVTYGFGGGSEGIAMYVDRLKDELKSTMLLTGAATLADIKPSMVNQK